MSVDITESINQVNVSADNNQTVEVITAGPQGATFSSSTKTLDDSARVDGSVIYYDSTAAEYKADNLQTILTLVDGGNF